MCLLQRFSHTQSEETQTNAQCAVEFLALAFWPRASTTRRFLFCAPNQAPDHLHAGAARAEPPPLIRRGRDGDPLKPLVILASFCRPPIDAP